MLKKNYILVCIDGHPKSSLLIRTAANKASELGLPWCALYVETPEHYSLDRDSREILLRNLHYAEQMGGEVHQVESTNVIEGVRLFVEEMKNSEKPVIHLIVGQSYREGFLAELKPSLAEGVTRKLRKSSTSVQIVPLSGKYYSPHWFDRLHMRDIRFSEIMFSLVAVFFAFLASELLRSNLSKLEWWGNDHNVMAFFLVATILSSMRYGLVPGFISALAGFSMINYFYIPPLNNFGLDNSADGISLGIFLVSAVVVSLMGAYSRATNKALVQKEKRSHALFNIHRVASKANNRQEALRILHEELSQVLSMEVAFFLSAPSHPKSIKLAYPERVELTEKDESLLNICWEETRATGYGTVNRLNSTWRFKPLFTASSEIGVMAVKVPITMRLDASFGKLLMALADQSAAIIERIDMAHMMSESQIREEREKLRSMLLSSVSHDLKTPLASIIGSLSVYERMKKNGRLIEETSNELIHTALEEAQRLDSFISNILDMTRLESGEISFSQEWVDVKKPVAGVKKRLRQRLQGHEFVVNEVTADNVGVFALMDGMMTEQVLQNIIDNAAKYSAKGTTITLSCVIDDDETFKYIVRDEGEGIPEDKLEAVFDKYERLKQSDSKVAGTGLGLAISRAVMEGQGGTISVRNHAQGGAEFTLTFPKYKLASQKQTEDTRRNVA